MAMMAVVAITGQSSTTQTLGQGEDVCWHRKERGSDGEGWATLERSQESSPTFDDIGVRE